MKIGTRYTLYAFAAKTFGGRLYGIANRRDGRDNGSVTVRDRWLAMSWPNTARGARSAAAWSCNTSEKSYRRAEWGRTAISGRNAAVQS